MSGSETTTPTTSGHIRTHRLALQRGQQITEEAACAAAFSKYDIPEDADVSVSRR